MIQPVAPGTPSLELTPQVHRPTDDHLFAYRLDLWERATRLPIARREDFRDAKQFDPRGQLQRRIDDLVMLAKLLELHMAVLIDVHRGRQPKTRIIQLRPNLTPSRMKPKQKRALPAALPPTQAFPIEHWQDVIRHIMSRELELTNETTAAARRRIELLRNDIAAAQDDDTLLCLGSQLREALSPPDSIRQHIRERVLQELAAHQRYAPLVRLLSPRVDPEQHVVVAQTHEISREERRQATQRLWDQRLLSVLTPSWQSSREIAARLEANPATVKERLRDLLYRGFVERVIITESKTTIKSKRNLRQSGQQVAMYRFVAPLARPRRES